MMSSTVATKWDRRWTARGRSHADVALLDRLRLLFYASAVFTLVSVVPSLMSRGIEAELVGLSAMAASGWLWTRTVRRRRLSLRARLAEPVFLLLAAAAAAGPAAVTGVFYVGLYFGALFGSRTATLLRGAAYFDLDALRRIKRYIAREVSPLLRDALSEHDDAVSIAA